ncbi:hypothetical protein LTH96_03065 [Nesterenkonia sp. LB17]|uniref:hypothetical protein n=1 Tax=Nesterenkonia sp. LB17 TaxID=2901230 RepID=UPI001F4C7A20|nr:hypothetical protein [Nesterenkonia sp. LB17]MCH8564725.1 hypothetical protein [Nesterenkonia sp. LB17]
MFELLLVLAGAGAAFLGQLFKSKWDRKSSLTDRRREAHAKFLGEIYQAMRLGATLKNVMRVSVTRESQDPEFVELRAKLSSSLAQVQILSSVHVAVRAVRLYDDAMNKLRGDPLVALGPAIDAYMDALKSEIN